jgi:2-(1,2-epoxy-1,2-dihydrophenyl)acetyl-CoA isomerase
VTKIYHSILFEITGTVATLTLGSTDGRNSLNEDTMSEIRHALRVVEEDREIRALLVTGAGLVFSAEVEAGPGGVSEVSAVLLAESNETLLASIGDCRVPVVMAINGLAEGRGCSLALAGDWLLAADSARLVSSERVIHGIPFEDSLNAADAEHRGLINECLDGRALLPRARELAATLAKGPTRALAMTRKLVDASPGRTFEEQYRSELEANQKLRESVDGKEGVQAFLEKRAARFCGE